MRRNERETMLQWLIARISPLVEQRCKFTQSDSGISTASHVRKG